MSIGTIDFVNFTPPQTVPGGQLCAETAPRLRVSIVAALVAGFAAVAVITAIAFGSGASEARIGKASKIQ